MLKSFFVVAVLLVNMIVGAQQVSAATNSVVIYQVFAGVGNASEEYVALYNNSDVEIDISNWCLTNKSAKELACFTTDADTEIVIAPHEFATVGSASLASAVYLDSTSANANMIVGSSDTISLVDSLKQVVDVAS